MLLSFSMVVTITVSVTWLLLRALIPHLRRTLVDQPNVRSSHTQPTPRGGGVAFVLVTAVASAISWVCPSFSGQSALAGSLLAMVVLPILALPLAAIGFLDDRYNLAPSLRYGVQLATAVLLILVRPFPFTLLLIPVLLIAVTGVINFTNFMDGLDGLVAGSMAVVVFALSVALAAPWPMWALFGSLLGFLIWNWSPAKVFMGDVGSTFLGAVFAGLVLQAPTWTQALTLLLVATPLLGDACICVLRRLLAGHRVLQAHRLHLFQRLQQAGWSHSRVSLMYVSATAVMAVALLVGSSSLVVCLSVLELLIGLWLDQRVAVPFVKASQS